MSDNTDRLLDMSRDMLEKGRRVKAIRDRAAAENRDLSRREEAELRTIKQELDGLRAQVPAFDPRLAQGTGRDVDPRERGDVLAPSESVRSWLAERGHLPAGGFDEPDRLSFGKIVRGAVTGNWRDAEHEQRALSESALGGGYLLGPALSSTVIDRVRNQMRV